MKKYTEKQLLAKSRNSIKFYLKGIQARLKAIGVNKGKVQGLTDMEVLGLEHIFNNFNELLNLWNIETFNIGLTPSPTWIVYNRNKKIIECELSTNSNTVKKALEYYESDPALYAVKKLVTQLDFSEYYLKGARIFPEYEKFFIQNLKL
jgi:hypothetical protein